MINESGESQVITFEWVIDQSEIGCTTDGMKLRPVWIWRCGMGLGPIQMLAELGQLM